MSVGLHKTVCRDSFSRDKMQPIDKFPVLSKHIGVWEGTFTFIDPAGVSDFTSFVSAAIDRFRFRVRMTRTNASSRSATVVSSTRSATPTHGLMVVSRFTTSQEY